MVKLVSVIIPNYNHGRYLAEAVCSVITQTYKYIEIIIVDNFSTDSTQDVVKKIKIDNPSATIKFFQYDNKGVIAASRNFGVKHSSGEYLAFLDSDDVWHKDKLSIQLKALSNKDIAAVATRFETVGSSQYSYDHHSFMRDKDSISYSFRDIVLSNPIVTSSLLMRKDNFDTLNGFNESLDYRFIEDWELWLRLSNQFGEILVINNKLVSYRIYKDKGRDLSDDAYRCLKIIDKQYNCGYIDIQTYRIARANGYINYTGKCYQANKKFNRTKLFISFFYTYSNHNKLRCFLFLFVSFFPYSFLGHIRKFFYYKLARK